MSSDYKVSRLEYEDLAKQANQLRKLARIPEDKLNFDVVDLLHHVVLPSLAQLGKNFRIDVDEQQPWEFDEPASVDLANERLEVADWVLINARRGDPHCRLIVAHEIAHMILHKDQVMAFSEEKAVRLNFIQPEESAEAQAHNFALLLLFPDAVVQRTRNSNAASVTMLTLVEQRWVEDRRFEYETRNKVSLQNFTGEQCEQCGSLAVLQMPSSTVCKSCGLTNAA